MSAVVLSFLVVFGAGGAAVAHDELVGSNPAEGASVEVLPPALELTFSNVPSGIGAQVQVLDETGTDWADGDVQVADRTVTQSLQQDTPAGAYTVSWRVVSSDSHPIEGTFAFTAEQDSTTPPDAATTAIPVETQDEPASETQQGGATDFPWSIVVIFTVLAVIAVALTLTARKRLSAQK